MRLYIAEKPSMGRELAKCLPGPVRRADGCLVTKGGVVTWLFGHILRQAEPDEYDPKYKQWHAEDLPIVPRAWKLIVDEKAARQFAIVKKLINEADEIVHGGDPDREGQLLVDEVLDYLSVKKPVKRILLNALDERSIKKANANLRNNSDFYALKQSALARARADWLIGMNLSRAYTLAARRAGHDNLVLPIGRVKTPTLALAVRREREIEKFKPVDYYTIRGKFQHENGAFEAIWKPRDMIAGLDSEGRLVDKAEAEKWLQSFEKEPKAAEITAYQKAKKEESAPLPFSLSTLQVLAGKMFGYAPQLVLDTAQKLYEKKLTTYPRSDCEYLPKNQFSDVPKILANLAGAGDESLAKWAPAADAKKKGRAWNDKKISAHHAIIPTTVPAKVHAMTAQERNLYFLIARSYIAQFYPPHVFDQTKLTVVYHGEKFTASGRTERDAGWRVMYQTKKKAEDAEKKPDDASALLPPMKKGDAAVYEKGAMKISTTKPPVRFTAATLLAGMKEIHKYVKNPEAKKQLKDVYGIGTEATRAAIIDDLIQRKFLHAEGKKKYLHPTSAAFLLVDVLPDEMTYPDSTAIWEDKLRSMSNGEGTLEDFLTGQIAFTKKLCAKAWDIKMKVSGENVCPRCHQGILWQRKGRNGIFWGCSNYPKCRMTANDKDGKPDLAEAERRMSTSAYSGGTQYASQMAGGGVGIGHCSPHVYAGDAKGHYPAANDEAELASLFSPESYEAQMEEAARSYENMPKRYGKSRGSWQSYAGKPKYSASPLEKMKQREREGKWKTAADSILCPQCREGHLRKIRGKNGEFWGCSNYPRCTATFDDSKGKPVL